MATLRLDCTASSSAPRRDHLPPPTQGLGMTNRYLELNGKPWLAVSGEFHFSRYPRAHWEEALRRIRIGGVEVVANYIFWIHHEEERGRWDWSGQRDIRAFVTICGELGLKVLLRIGPFAHGECRNGGLPDWIYGQPWDARGQDSRYLQHVRMWYGQIGDQMRGLLHKDGGPVIGIQIENEFMASAAPWETTHYPDTELTPIGSGGVEHMLTLKALARECGLDVPLWTCTAWGSPIPAGEFLPVSGGYAFYAWLDDPSTQPPSPNYVFRDFQAPDPTAAIPPESLPSAMCEMGSGMQGFYRNRPVIPAASVEAMGVVKLGSGANLIGWYVFHGMTNPMGRRGFLNEHRCPRLSYDYQAPLDLLGGSPSAQANLQVSTILRIVETPSEYLFSLNKPHFSSF